jgi:hypothetical protein
VVIQRPIFCCCCGSEVASIRSFLVYLITHKSRLQTRKKEEKRITIALITFITITPHRTAGVTGRKSMIISSQFVAGESAVNPLVTIYFIYRIKGEVLFFPTLSYITRDGIVVKIILAIFNFASNTK